MKDIAIYCAGGFGKEIACMIRIINEDEPSWNLIGFFDDEKVIGFNNGYGKVIGGINELNKYERPLSLVIANGIPANVHNIISKINNPHVEFPNLISPDVLFLDFNSVSLGNGNLFCRGCAISCCVSIGDFNTFNGAVAVGHDSNIGSFNSFMPSTIISGNVKIGDRNLFGISSTVLPKISVGSDTVIGANSLLIRKTNNGNTYAGNPATIVRY